MKRRCRFEDCGEPHHKGGYCADHYHTQVTENGDVDCNPAPAPVRVVRSRAKGSKLTSPNGLPVVCVTRGTKWGNPFTIADYPQALPIPQRKRRAVADYRAQLFTAPGDDDFRVVRVTVDDVKRELRGKNLACWCKESPCHADVLLEIANS